MKTIEPRQTFKGNATIFSITSSEVVLNTSATVRFTLFDDNMELLVRDRYTLTGEDYDNWGLDDEYLYTTLASKLGLVITGEYVPPQEEVIEHDD